MKIEIVTPEMRATCLEAHDALIDLAAERDRAIAAADRLKAALSIAVPMLINPKQARHSSRFGDRPSSRAGR